MTVFVDSSVLLDVLDNKAIHHQWCVNKLLDAQALGPVIVSDIVYSEISVGMTSAAEVDEAISVLSLARCGYSNEVLFRAAKAFKSYRDDNKGLKGNVLPDFLIGALAQVEAEPLLTRDPGKVSTYFPDVELIIPNG